MPPTAKPTSEPTTPTRTTSDDEPKTKAEEGSRSDSSPSARRSKRRTSGCGTSTRRSIAAGQEKVAELNERFGDWYFVISNDVYKKIHLGRDQVIKKKDAAGGGEAAPARPTTAPDATARGAAATAAEPPAPRRDDDAAAATDRRRRVDWQLRYSTATAPISRSDSSVKIPVSWPSLKWIE